MIKIRFKIVFLLFSLLILFSCTSDNNDTEVQENSNSLSSNKKVITIYNKEKSFDIWDNKSGNFSSSQELFFNKNHNLYLGYYDVDSISENFILLYKNIESFVEINIDNNQKINTENLVDLDNYIVLVLPSKPDKYGVFKNSFHEPKYSQAALLKSKLEWEEIFSTFEAYIKD